MYALLHYNPFQDRFCQEYFGTIPWWFRTWNGVQNYLRLRGPSKYPYLIVYDPQPFKTPPWWQDRKYREVTPVEAYRPDLCKGICYRRYQEKRETGDTPCCS